MNFHEYAALDGMALAELAAAGEVSPAELLDTAIAAVERLDPKINAISQRHFDEARAGVAAGLSAGPFTGVPFPLKDLGVLLAGTVTSHGCRRMSETADHDSTIVTRHKAAGLVLFAKTSTPELGVSVSTEPALWGPCRNPWDLGRSAGGSSGGAAAAVAAGIAPMARASDSGGSIRIPASCCGLFGLKPSRARTPLGPDRFEGPAATTTNHAITRSVRDSAALLDATAGSEPGEPYPPPPRGGPFLSAVGQPPGRLRIAWSSRTPDGLPVDRECAQAVEATAHLLESLGHDIEEAAPDFRSVLWKIFFPLTFANIAATLHDHAAATGRPLIEADVEPITWQFVQRAGSVSGEDYVTALNVAQGTGRIAADFHETYDVWLTPVTAQPAPELGVLTLSNPDFDAYFAAWQAYSPFTSYANLTGQPAMSVPLHWTARGLPIGLMFTGRYGEEALLFRLAGQLERARPWAARRPDLD